MLKGLLITLIIVGISMAFLAIKLIVKKNGRFPNTHIGHSAAMRKRGITCVQSMDAMERRKILTESASEERNNKL